MLGINNSGEIAGYLGSGAQGHPNKGYLIPPFSQTFVNENFPGSVAVSSTSVTAAAINNRGDVAGIYTTPAGTTDGFLAAPLH